MHNMNNLYRYSTYSMAKRLFDIMVAVTGFLVTFPIMAISILAVWLSDLHNPFYLAIRTGKGGRPFRMLKIRSMIVNADSKKVWATATDDQRITPIGKLVRSCKLDELPQLWNVIVGDMSLVGPRPLAPDETAVYTDAEKALLSIRPGITDIASIVFADEGELLAGCTNPTTEYDRLIRPWKSRLGLLYVHKRSIKIDIELVLITLVVIINKELGLHCLNKLMRAIGADEALLQIASRKHPIPIISPPCIGDIDL